MHCLSTECPITSPKSGDPLVFRTGSIDEFNHENWEFFRRIQCQCFESERTNTISSAWSENREIRSINHSTGVWHKKVYRQSQLRRPRCPWGVPGHTERRNVNLSAVALPLKRTATFVESLIKDPNATSKYGYPGYRTEGSLTDGAKLLIPEARIHQAMNLAKCLFRNG